MPCPRFFGRDDFKHMLEILDWVRRTWRVEADIDGLDVEHHDSSTADHFGSVRG